MTCPVVSYCDEPNTSQAKLASGAIVNGFEEEDIIIQWY
jgi:hypothetical protein